MTSRSALLAIVLAACDSSATPPPAAEAPGPTAPGPSSSTSSSSTTSSSSSGGGPTTLPVAKAPWGPEHCPAAGAAKVGFAVGESIGDLGLKDCDTGADASFDEVCGAAATWVFAAHTHCPTCQATSSFMDDVAKAVADKNVAIVLTVHDDNGTTCEKWRDVYKLAGLTNVRVYADPTAAAWDKLKTKNYTAPSAFLDGARLITFKEHSLVKDDVLKQIDAALAK